MREQPHARFERCHLKALGDACLQFELSYFVQQPKINPLLDLQQAVNFRIIDEFRRLGIEFAYPTQRVLVEAVAARTRCSTSSCTSRRFRRTPATRSGCARTPAPRLHLVKPLGFRLDDRSLQRSGLDYHDLADIKVHADLDACLRALGSARRHRRRNRRARTATRISAIARGMHSCSDRRPAACPSRCRSASDARTRCSFPCSRKAGVSIYRMPSQCSRTRRGGSSDLLPVRRSSLAMLRGPAALAARCARLLRTLLRAPHSVSDRAARSISACTAARTGLPSYMTRYTSAQIGMSTASRPATLRTARAARTPSTT